MTAEQDRVRAEVRVTAEQLAPGDRIVPWNDHVTARRAVAAVYASGDNVLIEWADRTVTRHHRWSVWHASNRRTRRVTDVT